MRKISFSQKLIEEISFFHQKSSKIDFVRIQNSMEFSWKSIQTDFAPNSTATEFFWKSDSSGFIPKSTKNDFTGKSNKFQFLSKLHLNEINSIFYCKELRLLKILSEVNFAQNSIKINLSSIWVQVEVRWKFNYHPFCPKIDLNTPFSQNNCFQN